MSEQSSRTVLDHPEQITRYKQQIQCLVKWASCSADIATGQRSAFARSLNLPLLATGAVSYATPHEREVLDIFTEDEQA